jgi:CdiI immunity protein
MELQDLESSYGVGTSAGLCGLWQPEAFSQVADLDSWEDEVADDSALIRHIGAGDFVPINVGGNGAFQVALRGRTSATVLSERETQYRLKISNCGGYRKALWWLGCCCVEGHHGQELPKSTASGSASDGETIAVVPRTTTSGRGNPAMTAYPQLAHLAGAYFHQDYDLDAPAPAGIIGNFVDGEEPAAIRELAAEIQGLLESGMTESQIGELWIKTLQASYEPAKDGLTYRAWLTARLDALERTGIDL